MIAESPKRKRPFLIFDTNRKLFKVSLLFLEVLKMGFSIASSNSFGQCYLIQDHSQRTGKKFASFHGNFKLSTLFTRAQSRKSFCCKLEGIDFQERTSPAEVCFGDRFISIFRLPYYIPSLLDSSSLVGMCFGELCSSQTFQNKPC